jgi:hypothetical protein
MAEILQDAVAEQLRGGVSFSLRVEELASGSQLQSPGMVSCGCGSLWGKYPAVPQLI